ncbi:S-adenosylmethionine uptake transporter [Holospora obtusa F1]|uniref:S-adenosylmethionine uptake transporter n=2 Tax=Holospora obtusa TaxID=49893 RepID=W6TD65_HOLOB|nr:S-adenosylmethionine uptake transporter [Holospora obtusa F1]
MLGMCLVSSVNDVIVKLSGLSGSHLKDINILFFRFFFATVTLIPLFLSDFRLSSFKKSQVHAIRGGLFALAMLPWCYSLIQLPIPLVISVGYLTPVFGTILASLILKESFSVARWISVFFGFFGVAVSVNFSFTGANSSIFIALLATFVFAVLDIVNKRLLTQKESLISTMFMPTMWSFLWLLPIAIWNWKTPSFHEMAMLLILGIGSNLMFFCLLKALGSYEMSALQPFKYSETVFSCIASFLCFNQIPSVSVLLGLGFIVPSALYLTFQETRSIK